MSTLLLNTKRHIPTLPVNIIARSELFLRANNNLSRQLTLVAAPAGYGKTTFVSSWVKSLANPVVWISLDDSDNDPALFWAYIITGFQAIIPASGSSFPEGKDIVHPTAIRTWLAQLINALTEMEEKVILVLDDYHLISNPQIHHDLAFLIENQPATLHIILTTRADPPLPIARLRGRGLLSEFRADDLRFNLEDATTFLNETMKLDLETGDIAALNQRTEGWIIGLQLAAISIQRTRNKSEYIANFSGGHHYILEYLTDEVVGKLSKPQRHFLLQTSILSRLSAPLCDAILNTHDSDDVLSGLHHNNLFITPLDDDHRWFCYNHLFVDLLKNLLRREFSQEYIYELHRRASMWFEKNEFPSDAIEHAMQAQNFEHAAGLIEQVARGTMHHGRLKTLLRWIEALPETILNHRPRLRFYQAWALSLGGKPKIAEQILKDTKLTLEALPTTPDNLALRGELAVLLTGILSYTNDPPRIIQEAQEALTYLSEDNLISFSRVYMALGTAYAYGDEMEKAIQTYQTARDTALKAKNPFLAAAAAEMLAGIQIYHLGHLRSAEQNLNKILELGKTGDGVYQAFTGTAHILLAEINLEWNHLDAAKSYLEKGLALLQQGGIGYSLAYTCCTKARARFAAGDTEGVLEALHAAASATRSAPLMHILMHNLSCQIKFALYLGDIETAARWAKHESVTVTSEIPEPLPAYLYEVRQISLARVYLAQGQPDKVLEMLNEIQAQAESAGRTAHVIEICLQKALAYQKQNQVAEAIQSLERSISFAAAEGFTRIYLEAGIPGLELLHLAARQGSQSQYLRKLLAAFDEYPIETPGPLTRQPDQHTLVEPLSERECEILGLIAEGYTNQQIADMLVVTLNTIKKHTSNIYGKMGVKNRTQAIARSRELDLIPR